MYLFAPEHCIILMVLYFLHHSLEVDLHVTTWLLSVGEEGESKVDEHLVTRLGTLLDGGETGKKTKVVTNWQVIFRHSWKKVVMLQTCQC